MRVKNALPFHELVKGHYGRKIAYTSVERIDETNVVKVLGDCLPIFIGNKRAIDYLYNYYKGDQPILYRKKVVRDDIVNKVVENHAFELVSFKVGQSYGEPIQIVALENSDKTNKSVEKFNSYTRAANKPARDVEVGTWQSAVGTGYKGIQFSGQKDLPFRIVCLSPMNTFVIYSSLTHEPLAAVQELKDADNKVYYLLYTDTTEFRIQNSKLMPVYNDKGEIVYSKLHGFGGIPIVEYPNNADRLSDIELVTTMLDAINTMQSNRMDGVEQFIQSFFKFVNCQIDETSFAQMKQMGALMIQSTGDTRNVEADVISQELDQGQSQIAKKDLWDNVLSISAVPNTEHSSDGGSTQGAVSLRSGWDFSKQRAKLKDPFIIESERRIISVALNIIRIDGEEDLKLKPYSYDVQINHSPTDNMQVKVQSLQMLLQAGISPIVAISVVGLFQDPEKVYGMSKPYLDVLYKTVDDIIEESPDLQKEQEKAKDLLKQDGLNDWNKSRMKEES